MAQGIAPSMADYQVEDDLRTLARAEEIRSDKKRYKAALALAKEKIQELQYLQEEADEEAGEDESKETTESK